VGPVDTVCEIGGVTSGDISGLPVLYSSRPLIQTENTKYVNDI